MKVLAGMVLVALAAVMGTYSQVTAPEEDKVRLKRSQIEAMLKADHERSIGEAAQLVTLSRQLQEELEKNDRHVLSMTAIKKAEEIEKLAKRIRSRMKRY